jgi:hypothetical protein
MTRAGRSEQGEKEVSMRGYVGRIVTHLGDLTRKKIMAPRVRWILRDFFRTSTGYQTNRRY